MLTCPQCGNTNRQVKAGKNNGTQRYKCALCQHRYTPESSPRGYSDALRHQAIELHSQGIKIREIGRQLDVHPQSVINWIRRKAEEEEESPETVAPVATPYEQPEILLPGKKRPTIANVAQQAGVSISTISNYLNDKGRMSEATRSRIQAAMEKLHFTPSALVRAIRHRRTRILGLLVFGLSGLDVDVGKSLTPPLLAGIYQAADRTGQDILLYAGWPDRPQRHSGLDFLNGHIDGLLWVAPDIHTPALEWVEAAGLPVVALLTRHVPDGVGYVNADNIGGMVALITYLAEQGHRRMAIIGPDYASNFMDRLEGYRLGLKSVGIKYDAALEVNIRDLHWSVDAYRRALDGLLAHPQPPTAILTTDDSWAAWIIEALRARGIRVPEDIAVTGFNDIPDAERLANGLTTIRQPFRQIGQVAVERLLAMIEGAPVEECRVTLPIQVIVRASTAARHSPETGTIGT